MTKEETPTNRPVWDIENSHPEIVEPFKTRMREVVDPELGLDIIALGLVRNVRIDDGSGYLYMILTTPFCPYGPAMIEQPAGSMCNYKVKLTAVDQVDQELIDWIKRAYEGSA